MRALYPFVLDNYAKNGIGVTRCRGLRIVLDVVRPVSSITTVNNTVGKMWEWRPSTQTRQVI